MIHVYKLEEEGQNKQNKQVDCQLGSVIRRLDGKKHRTGGRRGAERGMKRGSRERSTICFLGTRKIKM